MTRRLFSPSTGRLSTSIRTVSRGGTESVTAASARTVLGAVALAAIDQPNGVASLLGDKMPSTLLPVGYNADTTPVVGLDSLYIYQQSSYTIPTYSSLETYSLSAIGGTVSRIGNTITYTAPSAPGSAGFVLNGKTYAVNILPAGVTTPSITTPANGALNRPWKQDVSGSAFGFIGVGETHASSDWQIATDSGFNNIIASSLNDTVNKTTWTVTDLDPGVTYYLRVRYNGTIYGPSNWSSVSSFVTRSSFLPVAESAILTANDAAASDGFGIYIGMSADGTRIAVGALTSDPGGLSGAGAVYVYLRTGMTWTLEQKLTASDKAAGDNFGGNIRITPDGTRVLITAVNATVGGIANCGAAYIFTRSGTTWTQEAKLSASDKAATDHFAGYGIGITDAGDRVVVGAKDADISGLSACGAAYVFVRSGTTWTQEAKLAASDKAATDGFGEFCDISSDGTRVLVGSPHADVGGITDAGAAYVFSRSGTTWTQEAKLSASDKAASDFFGIAVNISATGDRALVGAFGATVSGMADAGAIYSFTRSGTTWTQEAKLVAKDPLTNTNFGYRIAVTPDFTTIATSGDTATIGGLSNVGAVYIFTRSGSTWSQKTKITAEAYAANYYFGIGLTISADGTLLGAGSTGYSLPGVAACGGVYFYSPADYVMAEEAILTANDKAANDAFGAGLALSSDGSRLAIGAPNATVSGVSSCGAVYIYTRSGTTWTLEQKLSPTDRGANDQLGNVIEFTAAADRIIINSVLADVGGLVDCGAAYVFVRSGSTWTQEAKLLASDRAAGDNFATFSTRITPDGTRAIVGSQLATVGGLSQAGALYVFTRSGSTWTQEAKLTASDKAATDGFGFFAAITDAGDRIAAGAAGADVGGITNCGAVYVFTRSGTTWTQEAKLTASDKAASDQFGIAVQLSSTGDRLIASSFTATVSGITNAGAVYVFTRSGTTWTQEAKLVAVDATAGGRGYSFGERIAVTPDMSTAAISSLYATAGSVTGAGAFYVYTRSGSTWQFNHKYTASVPVLDDWFSTKIDITNDGSMVAVGANGADPGGISNAGSAYVFR